MTKATTLYSFRNRMPAFWNRMPVRGGSMATTSFSLPKHWEDWIAALLGLWLVVSPMALQYGEMAAAQNAFLVGILLIIVEFFELTVFRAWEEWINVILGAWLVVSPWFVGGTLIATANFVIVGLLVLALALYEIWDERQHLRTVA
jgi:hypothetical protein